jgi:hypothetical protein
MTKAYLEFRLSNQRNVILFQQEAVYDLMELTFTAWKKNNILK